MHSYESNATGAQSFDWAVLCLFRKLKTHEHLITHIKKPRQFLVTSYEDGL